MKLYPYEVAIIALQEIGRNDLIYFIDHPYSRGIAREDNGHKGLPHFDTAFIGNKEVPNVPKGIKVPYVPRHFSCSDMYNLKQEDRPWITSHSDFVAIQHCRLFASHEDLALVERAMFLAFKYAGVKYTCEGCENEFRMLGVRLTKETDVL